MTKLTERFIKSLKADDSRTSRRFSDGRNLYLNVTKSGAKSWLFIWLDKKAGYQREIGLGSYTGDGRLQAVSLEDARALADVARTAILAGKDPRTVRTNSVTLTETFEQVMLRTLAAAKIKWSVSNRDAQEKQWISGFRDHAPKLLSMPIDLIDVAAVASALQPYAPTKVKENVRERIKKVLDAATTEGLRTGSNPAAWTGCLEHVLHVRYSKANAVPHKEMAFEELPAFVGQLNALALGGDNAAAGLLFTILNANRTDEVREMTRDEVNLETGVWSIPANRMKAKKAHTITLSAQSVALLRSVSEVTGNRYFFTGLVAGKPVGETAFLDRLYSMGHEGKATVHGFRATFTDWAGEHGYSTEVTEMATAHAIKGARKSYRRREATALRKDLLQVWSDYCFGVSNVVTFKVAA